ncbi:MAG: 3-phosphoshikimate 1-carboxyvinyltransferase [Ruminococcus sp.]|nr:3-phosphoshikimate 1-carboxyvinyltransferase [Ruminococcus sp.]
MDIKIEPSVLSGRVRIPSSKSYAHRLLICAGLSSGKSVIRGISRSKDIDATISSMKALGADFVVRDDEVEVTGIVKANEKAVLDCCESGSTLRFLIPVAAALGVSSTFCGQGRLPQRPIDIFIRELSSKGITFDYSNTMPFDISGKLKGGVYKLEGNVSSQFVTGLLFALPLLEEDSEIIMTSRLESKPYVDMTVASLKMFGVTVTETENGYKIKGGQSYRPCSCTVEGDFSQAAFYYVANAIGCNIQLENLNSQSVQGDKKILDIIQEMCYNENVGRLKSFNADCSDIPDLVPILAVLGCFGDETSEIHNAERLRIKESDRLAAVSEMLNTLGGKVTVLNDGLRIEPSALHGGTINSFGDHRIVMSAAIAATKASSEVIIKGAEAVEKSYPDFFRDYNILGGKTNVINLD